MKVVFPRLFPVIVLPLIAFSALFYFSLNFGNQLELVNNRENTTQPNLLPVSSPRLIQTSEGRLKLQAQAYNHFLSFFGPANVQVDLDLVEPVEGFKERITKKSFGIYITPETSPVQPDKFTGYHAGVDIEFEDILEDISILAITDGIILIRTQAAGYGGVVVIRHIINEVPVIVIYGHLDPGSFLPLNVVEVKTGDKIGVLGDGYSEETDGARKHLHFSMYPDRGDEKIDFRGYVETEEELTNWLNPLDFYQ